MRKMSSCLKKTIGWGFFIIIVAYFHSIADAYVLQGQHILELMIARLGQAESLFVSQKVSIYKVASPSVGVDAPQEQTTEAAGLEPLYPDQRAEGMAPVTDDLAPQIIEMEESLRYLFSKAFRSDIVRNDNQRIHVFAEGDALTVIDGTARERTQTRFDLYKDILLFRTRPELSERLLQLNVDVSVTRLDRFEDKIAFVIGTEYPDDSLAQLWVDKETFLPLRWIITNGAGGFRSNTLEVRYLEWWQLADNFWYPMRIEFFQGDELVRVIQAQRYEINPTFSEDLFDINQLRSMYPAAPPALNDSDESEGVSEVQKTLEEFKKIFE